MGSCGTRRRWFPGRHDGPTFVGPAASGRGDVGTAGARALVSAPARCEVRDHLYPGDGDCVACHTSSGALVLGVNTRQWNRAVEDAGVKVNQLLLAQRRGLLDGHLDEPRIATFRRLVPIDATSASVEDRVRSYLDVNCSQCHRPGNVAQVAFDARFDTPLSQQALVGAPVRWPNVSHVADQMVYPKAPDRSRVYSFMSRRLMPPVGNLLVHEQALDLLRGWIMELPGPPALVSVTIRRSPPGPAGRPIEVSLSHPDPQAAIHYTIDGTGPGPDTPDTAVPSRCRPRRWCGRPPFGRGTWPAACLRSSCETSPALPSRTRLGCYSIRAAASNDSGG